jgi:hypothetical protein
MRRATYVWLLPLILTASAAVAQSGMSPAATGNAGTEAWLAEEQSRFAQCMRDWDAKTHMTKRQWERTCRRVTDERIKYLRDSGHIPAAARQSQTGRK